MDKIDKSIAIQRLVEHAAHSVIDMKEKDLKCCVKDILLNLFNRYSDEELLAEIKLLDEIEEESRLN